MELIGGSAVLLFHCASSAEEALDFGIIDRIVENRTSTDSVEKGA